MGMNRETKIPIVEFKILNKDEEAEPRMVAN